MKIDNQIPEMTFEVNSGRKTELHRIVYIEYQNGKPHEVITDNFDGFMAFFDFEEDCHSSDEFMFFESGGGGKITEIQAPHYDESCGIASYWIHPEANFKEGRFPINCVQLDAPIQYNGNSNPFENGRKVYSLDYCKFCDKFYDEYGCEEHFDDTDDEGNLKYFDGSLVYD
ncbi:hypothetical protein LV89_03840 [Arcicella aurantiaca]|uniref:Uncharacterized protein n=1 Tax=Arcicella aurantiaca TaxID=591202 RepID=A0A316DPY1_9BACT|nr:hypothetical protein [Arcicella aurantiaca]PWK20297.1 hypothetical protein LV89_03840 [Arcicella aurantiaca]